MRVGSATHSVFNRWFAALLAAALVAAIALPALASAEESEFIALINQSRSAQGLGTLSEFWDLTDDARVHTAAMISAGQIYHSTNGELSNYTTGWARMGENVGMGPNPSLLHQAFMNSPGHRANILGDFDRVGVGTARSGDGTLFVTVLFMKSSQPAPTTTTTAPAPTTTTTTAPPTTAPTTTTTAPAAGPTTTTTVPVTTTAPAAGPTTTTTTTTTSPAPTSRPETTDSQPGALFTRTLPPSGIRPATRVSNIRADRSVDTFRPIFRYLDGDHSQTPITVITSNGVEITIE